MIGKLKNNSVMEGKKEGYVGLKFFFKTNMGCMMLPPPCFYIVDGVFNGVLAQKLRKIHKEVQNMDNSIF